MKRRNSARRLKIRQSRLSKRCPCASLMGINSMVGNSRSKGIPWRNFSKRPTRLFLARIGRYMWCFKWISRFFVHDLIPPTIDCKRRDQADACTQTNRGSQIKEYVELSPNQKSSRTSQAIFSLGLYAGRDGMALDKRLRLCIFKLYFISPFLWNSVSCGRILDRRGNGKWPRLTISRDGCVIGMIPKIRELYVW